MKPQSRRLGFFENLLFVGGQSGAFQMTRVMLFDRLLDESATRDCIHHLARHVAALQATIKPAWNGNRFVWTSHPKIPELQIIRCCQSAQSTIHWQDVAANELLIRFDEGGPLWRASLILDSNSHQSQLVFSFSHAICDGVSVMMLMRWFMQLYEKRTRGLPLEDTVPQSAGEIIGPITRVEGSRLSLLSKGFFQLINHRNRARHTKHWECFSNSFVPYNQRRTVPWFTHFDKNQSRKFVIACKAERVTVNGAFTAIALRAAQNQFNECPQALSCSSNFDLRRHYRMNPDFFGCGVFFVNTLHSVNRDESIWQSARTAGQLVLDKVKQTETLPSGLFSFAAGLWLRAIRNNQQNGRISNMGISNLGKSSLPEHAGEAKLIGTYGITGQHVVGADVMIIMNNINDNLFCSVMFVEPLVPVKSQKAFVEDFRREFESAISDQPFRGL